MKGGCAVWFLGYYFMFQLFWLWLVRTQEIFVAGARVFERELDHYWFLRNFISVVHPHPVSFYLSLSAAVRLSLIIPLFRSRSWFLKYHAFLMTFYTIVLMYYPEKANWVL